MYYDLVTRFRDTLGRPGMGGDWNPDTAVVHARQGGRTLCGRRIGLELHHNGPWQKHDGWLSDVNCAHCLRKLDKEKRQLN
jgi:hypothetical protein